MPWIFLFISIFLLPVVAAQPTRAQDAPPALVVRLRDVVGAGVAGVTIIVADQSGATVLDRATTDATGSATFGPLPATDIRVRVEGRLADGTQLVQPGADAAGIAVILGAPPVTLELRSEADGTVLPDPATALALEPGIEAPLVTADPAQVPPALPAATALAATVTAFPTAPLATTGVAFPPAQPASAAAPTLQAAPQASSVTEPAEAPTAPRWLGLLLLGVLGLALATVVFAHLRGGEL